MAACLGLAGAEAGTYSGGSGTPEDPYRIGTVDDLHAAGTALSDWDNTFILISDLDCQGLGPSPLGLGEIPFSGDFNGNGHSLSNVAQNLFDHVSQTGRVRNLRIHGFGYHNQELLGLVRTNDGLLTNCSVTGDPDPYGSQTSAGVVGENNGTLIQCSFEGHFQELGHGGGLVDMNRGSIIQCRVNATVGIWGEGGGLAYQNWGLIRDSYARGHMGAEGRFGGLVGINGGQIINCYAAGGTAEPYDGEGGGLIWKRGTVCHREEICEDIGDGEIWCYWGDVCEPVGDEIASFENLCCWYNCNPGWIGPNLVVMQKQATYTDAGWDFVGESANGTEDVWRMCGDGIDYPRLSWEFSQGGDMACPNGVGMEDLVYLAGRWMASTPATFGAADGNADGRVDLLDLAIVSENWGK